MMMLCLRHIYNWKSTLILFIYLTNCCVCPLTPGPTTELLPHFPHSPLQQPPPPSFSFFLSPHSSPFLLLFFLFWEFRHLERLTLTQLELPQAKLGCTHMHRQTHTHTHTQWTDLYIQYTYTCRLWCKQRGMQIAEKNIHSFRPTHGHFSDKHWITWTQCSRHSPGHAYCTHTVL